MDRLAAYFELKAAGTTHLKEALAGLATFLAMAYILFVNPDILSGAFPGVERASLMSATALAAALGTAVMGIWGRYPFALAPGMGLNAFFAFNLVGTMGMSYQAALTCVFISGLIFIGIGGFGIRSYLVDAIPHSLKMAMTAGIGLFIAFIGLKSAGIVVASPATLVTVGEVTSPPALTCLVGLFLMAGLVARRIPAGILVGIVGATAFAIVLGLPVFGGKAFTGFDNGVWAMPVWPTTFWQMDFAAAFGHKEFFTAVFMILFVDFFDTTGTLFGLGQQAGFLDSKGRLPRAGPAFVADGIATTCSAIVGTSPTTTYIESATGISQGGKTGLTAVWVAVLFLLSLFFYPLLGVVPSAAVAPALIMVGVAMMSSVGRIEWQNTGEALPAFLVLLVIPLSFSIAEGIAFGIVGYCVMALFTSTWNKLSPVLVGLGLLCALRWAFLL